MGYYRAGFTEIIGIDIAAQPHYPFTFVQADALEYVVAHAHEFDAIHASPPCQLFSRTRAMRRRYAAAHYIDLLTPLRAILSEIKIPWVIENVPGAPPPWDCRLCGTMFGLRGRGQIHRHRLFQCSEMLPLFPVTCSHTERAMNVYTSGQSRYGTEREFCDGMGVTWGNTREGLQAIPPAYTELIGKLLIARL